MSGYGPTCRAFVGTFGVADGETIAHPHNCYRSYCPHFSDCGSGYVMPLLAFCHRAEHPVAVFYLIKRKSQRPIRATAGEKWQGKFNPQSHSAPCLAAMAEAERHVKRRKR
jgi:hypothetical protein